MCGILCIFDTQSLSVEQLRKLALSSSKLIRHRGPDWSGVYLYASSSTLATQDGGVIPPATQLPAASSVSNGKASKECKNAVLVHERLAIIDPESGAQPLVNPSKDIILLVNGEIYNYQVLKGRQVDGDLDPTLTDSAAQNGVPNGNGAVNGKKNVKKSVPTASHVVGKLKVPSTVWRIDAEKNPEVRDYPYQTSSDCEVILSLYETFGNDTPNYLDGMFSFVIWDERKKTFYAARDHMGITPLYIGWRSDGGIVFASEMKALQGMCERYEIFPPGHYFCSETSEFVRWYNPIWWDPKKMLNQELDYAEFRARFEKSVVKMMMSDVPWGVLLSGGLDSSLVSAVAMRHAAKNQNWPTIHSFSVGLKDSPDLRAAAKVAAFLGTKHHSFTFTVQEGLDALSEVIYHLETYDVTTIRASTPMFLMARKIKAMGVKMVLSGEGADECLGGYLYFHKAPNKEEFHKETVTKLSLLHYYDCLRANKSMSAFGVEPRVPFLDREWLDYVMTLDPEYKMCKVRKGDEKRGSIEKYIMRKAFDIPEDPFLPEEFLWRQKEQFSDGVGYSWIDSLRERADQRVSAAQWATRKKRFPVNTPQTKEAYLYRSIFHDHFPGESARDSVLGGPSVACSTPAAIEWDEQFKKLAADVGGDQSGRSVAGIHRQAYTDAGKVASGEIKAHNVVENDDSTPIVDDDTTTKKARTK